jgi:hypothetical protein
MKCRVHSDYGVAFSLYSVHDIQSCMEAMLATIQSMAVRAHIQVIKQYILSLTSRGSGASAFIHARLDDAVRVGAAIVAARPSRRSTTAPSPPCLGRIQQRNHFYHDLGRIQQQHRIGAPRCRHEQQHNDWISANSNRASPRRHHRHRERSVEKSPI